MAWSETRAPERATNRFQIQAVHGQAPLEVSLVTSGCELPPPFKPGVDQRFVIGRPVGDETRPETLGGRAGAFDNLDEILPREHRPRKIY